MNPDLLYPSQKPAYEFCLSILNESRQVGLLQGSAGVGKTAIIQATPQGVKKNRKVAYTATTNQAVKVLRSKLPACAADCMTIHSFLGLKLKKVKGKTMLSQEKQPLTFVYDAVCIDEASMVTDEIFELLMTTARITGTSVLFIGDIAQLNPVNEDVSKVFTIKNQYKLTEMVRQALDNPVLRNTRVLRRVPDFHPNIFTFAKNEETGDEFARIRSTDWMPTIEEWFSSQEWTQNNDLMRVLCWTNENVAKINKFVHELRHGKTECPYTIGEKIIACEPIAEGAIVTSEECIVRSISEAYVENFPCWKFELEGDYNTAFAYVLLDSVKDVYKKKIQTCIEAEDWHQYYKLSESFSNIQHNYCMTSHRSQGSTFDNVIVDVGDITRNMRRSEVLRMLYVALSRPRHSAYVKL